MVTHRRSTTLRVAEDSIDSSVRVALTRVDDDEEDCTCEVAPGDDN
jgi:hypothetical protein